MPKVSPPLLPDTAKLTPTPNFTLAAQQAADSDTPLEYLLVQNQIVEGLHIKSLTAKNIIFDGCRFVNCVLERSQFTTVWFKACDVSTCNFADSRFVRATWQNCKGLGTILADSYQQDIWMQECNFTSANFAGARFFTTSIRDCDLSAADLSGCKFTGIGFSHTKLCGTSFYHTLLKGIDLSSCDITGLGIEIQCKELQGAIIDTFQSVDIAGLAGIKIK